MSGRSRRRPARKPEEAPSIPVANTTNEKHVVGASSFGLAILGISVAAFFLRLLHVFQTGAVPSAVYLMGDAKGYFDWASRIAGGAWYGEETFYQAPLYPYFLAVVISVFGESVVAIRICQCVLGATAVGLLGWATERRFGRAAGLVAAIGFALLPAAVYYDGLVQKASLASFLLCLFLFAIARWGVAVPLGESDAQPRYPALLNVFGAGVSLALLVLVRENTLLWTPLPMIWLWLHQRRSTGEGSTNELTARKRGLASCAYVAGLAVILFPVAARNASLGGEWSPTTFQAGPNFYIGNNQNANGLYLPLVPGHETPLHERSDAVRLAERESGRELTSREVSQFWFRKAGEEIGADPGRWLQLLAIKCVMVVNYFEVPDVESLTVYRDASIVLLMFDRVWHFGTLSVLAAIGFMLTRSQWRAHWLWYALIGLLVAATVGFFILGRYRFPLVPLLLPLAGVGAVQTWTLIRQGRQQKLVPALVLAVMVAIVCHYPIHDTRRLNASSIANVGAAAASRGDLDLGIKLFRRALQEVPTMPEAHVNLGRALFLQGNLAAAITEYQIALKLEPDLVDVDFFLATALERGGNLEASLFHYRRAVQIDPGNQRAQESIARILNAMGG